MRRILLLIFILSSIWMRSQTDRLGVWTDHIPHSTIYDIVKVGNRVFCATEVGLFIYNDESREVVTYSKLNGLSDIGIKAMAYDHKRGNLLIGYANGNIDVFDGANIRNVNDIVRSSKFTGKKRVNDIKINEDVAYISTGFGIIELDLEDFIVLNTLIIGPNASELEVYEVEIDLSNDKIYAATDQGLFKANFSDPLIFFSFWNLENGLPTGTYSQVDIIGDIVIVVQTTTAEDDLIYFNNGSLWDSLTGSTLLGKISDVRSENNSLAIVTTFSTNTYLDDLTPVHNISEAYYEKGTYQPRVAWPESNGNLVWIGNNSYGLIRSENVDKNRRILPNGPFSNQVYRMESANNELYVAPGAIDEIWNRRFYNDGIFKYSDFEWKHINSEDIGDIKDIVKVTVDPQNPNKIYANGWGTGILEIKNDKLDTIWDVESTNGILQSATGSGSTDVRTGGLTFDEEGNMWITNSLCSRPLVVRYANGTWDNFSLGSLASGSTAFKDIAINELGQIWMQTRKSGIIVVQFDNGFLQANEVKSGVGKGNLPDDQILCFAEDLDGEMWIGTIQGLVVLYSPQNLFNGRNYDAQPILFEEDGVVQRLLGTEQVTTIAVDGANKKWFGTQNSGVFYTSEDGTETIYHFTAENSPLLSNNIFNIEIDEESGEVFFGTAQGVVSFRGAATRGYETFTNVYAYPNPVRPEYQGPIYIRGLATNAQVKITDVQGNIVYEMVAEGGQAIWGGTDLSGNKVSSGVYIANLNNDDGSLSAVTKILIIK